jgi:hypothetical protein
LVLTAASPSVDAGGLGPGGQVNNIRWDVPLLFDQPKSNPSILDAVNSPYEACLVSLPIKCGLIINTTNDAWKHLVNELAFLVPLLEQTVNVWSWDRQTLRRRNFCLRENDISEMNLLCPYFIRQLGLRYSRVFVDVNRNDASGDVSIGSWRPAVIDKAEVNVQGKPIFRPSNGSRVHLDFKPRSLVGDVTLPTQFVSFRSGAGGNYSSIGGSPILSESPYEEDSADSGDHGRGRGKYGLKKCVRLLPARSVGGLPLSAQVGIVTLIGAAFLGGCAFGTARLLAGLDTSRPTRLRSWLLVIICAPIGLGLYSLAGLGDWRAVFGLCSFP